MSYAGEKAFFMDESTLCYQCGNSIKFLNVASGVENFLGGINHSMSNVIGCPKAGLLAYAEQGTNPNICIYNYPRLRPVGTLAGAAELGFDVIAMSPDGATIAAASSAPDVRLSFWVGGPDWSTPECRGTVELPLRAVALSFNPQDSNELCLVDATGKSTMWKLGKTHESFKLESWSPVAEDALQDEVTAHAWSPNNQLVLGYASGAVYGLDLATHEVGDLLASTTLSEPRGYAVTGMAVTKGYVVAGFADGQLAWCAESAGQQSHQSNVAGAAISCINVAQDYSSLWLGVSDGSILQVGLASDAGADPVNVAIVFKLNSTPILAAASLTWQGSSMAVTTSADGCIRVWDSTDGKLLGKHETGTAVTSLDVCSVSGLAAVGTVSGVVRLIDLSTPAQTRTIFKARLHQSAVAHAAFSPDGSLLASVGEDGKVFFMDASGTSEFKILGYMLLPSLATSISWRDGHADDGDGEGLHLLVATHGKQLLQLKPPSESDEPPADFQLTPLAVDMRVWRLDAPLRVMRVSSTATGTLYAFSAAGKSGKVLRIYDLRGTELTHSSELTDGKRAKLLKYSIPSDIGHQKDGTCISFSSDGKIMASGGEDGAVVVRSMSDIDGRAKCLRRHGMADVLSDSAGGVACLAFGAGGDFYTGGSDGALFQFVVKGAVPSATVVHLRSAWVEAAQAIAEPVSAIAGAPAESVDGGENEPVEQPDPTALEAAEADVIALRAAEEDSGDVDGAQQESAGLRESLAELKEKFQACLANNAVVPELEKMDRQEFVIDLEDVAKIKAAADAEATALKEQVTQSNLERQTAAEKIIVACYEPMAVHSAVLQAFESGLEVPNFPLRKQNEQTNITLKNVMAMRKAEIAERAWLQENYPGDLGEATASGDYVGEDSGKANGTTDVAVEKDKAEEDDADDAEEDAEDADAVDDGRSIVDDLLYDPLELATSRRKQAQMVMTEAKILNERTKYKKMFDDVMGKKLSTIDAVKERRKRLQDIVTELGALGEGLEIPPQPSLADEEVMDSVLSVKDEEIAAPKWISAEQRKVLEEEEAARLKREADSKDSPFERALMDMMNGSLDGNENKMRLDEVIEKPEWMIETLANDEERVANGDEAVTTEEQKKEIEDWEAMVAARAEVVEKTVGILKTEFRKNVAEIAEAYESFDDKLSKLFADWMASSQTIFELELWLVRLSNAVLTEEELRVNQSRLEAEVQTLMKEKGRASQELKQFTRDLQAEQDKRDALASEEKSKDKLFKREFADAAELTDDLLRLFKGRVRPVDASGRKCGYLVDLEEEGMAVASQPATSTPATAQESDESDGTFRGGLGAEDPWNLVEQRKARAHAASVAAAAIDPLVKDMDCPESLPGYIWDRLVVARDAKIALEAELKEQTAIVADMKGLHAKLASKEGGLKANMDSTQDDLQQCKEGIERINTDLELQLKLKQGQVEVEQSAVVTDFGDAVLISNRVVEELNRHIKGRGCVHRCTDGQSSLSV
jgi:WD40 repeat protein